MARIETHEQDCQRLLGGKFTYVHEWLDYFAKQLPVEIFFEAHRKYRHNKESIDLIARKWGKIVAQAAKLHIIRDYNEFLSVSIVDMKAEQIDELYEVALKYCPPLKKD